MCETLSAMHLRKRGSRGCRQDRLRAYGAKVLVRGDVWDEANAYAKEICATEGAWARRGHEDKSRSASDPKGTLVLSSPTLLALLIGFSF